MSAKSGSVSMKAAAMGALLVVLISCGDKPNEPIRGIDYSVYIGSFNTNWLCKYKPQNGVLDSFQLPIMPQYFPNVSADGEEIFINCRDSVLAVNVTTSGVSKIWGPRSGGGVIASPDKRLIAITGNGLDILRASDYSHVYHDSTTVGSGQFSDDSRHFYAAYDDPARIDDGVYRLTLDSGFAVTRTVFSGASVRLIAPSADETRWYLYFDVNWDQSIFAVYDVSADSFIFSQTLRPGQGDMCRTPNDRYVFFTSPGSLFPGSKRSTLISVYDTRVNNVTAQLDAAGQYGDDSRSYDICIHRMAVTPDSRWLLGTADGFWGWLVVDVSTLQVEKRESLGIDHVGFEYVLCQSQI